VLAATSAGIRIAHASVGAPAVGDFAAGVATQPAGKVIEAVFTTHAGTTGPAVVEVGGDAVVVDETAGAVVVVDAVVVVACWPTVAWSVLSPEHATTTDKRAAIATTGTRRIDLSSLVPTTRKPDYDR